jgi:penicillin-binding protein 2
VSQRSHLRLVVLQVLVLSLMLTLFGRLYYLQVIAGETYQAQAADNRIREVVTPAARGLILDDVGRPLAQNRTTLVVSVDRKVMEEQEDEGEAVLRRVAKTLGKSYEDVYDAIQLCYTPGAKKPPVCWNGSPYQPVPVAKDVKESVALAIMERSELYPGVTAELAAVRDYAGPEKADSTHVVGYLGPITAAEIEKQKADAKGQSSQGTDLIGRDGIELMYDEQLRGRSGVESLAVDMDGAVQGTVGTTPSVPGNYVVTNIDAKLQAVVEKALADGVKEARTRVHGATNTNFKADSAAAVVLDVQEGKVLALSSYPSYDPNVWTGGVTQKEFDRLNSKKAGSPLVNRAISGQYSPASTFKTVSAAASVEAGSPFYGSYECPSYVMIGDRRFQNFEAENLGTINMQTAIEKSCDTIFYNIAYDEWVKDGGLSPVAKPDDTFLRMAKKFGFGKPTGIDLPNEASGLVADRAYLQKRWDDTHEDMCAIGRGDVKGQTPFQVEVAQDYCTDGYKVRAGDAVNFSIGQGDTLATPLQLATSYAAIANGGQLLEPQVARAVVSPTGEVVEEFERKVTGDLDLSEAVLRDLQLSLDGVTVRGTAENTFASFPLGQVPVSGKTGTAEGVNAQPTAWFASYAPSDKPRFAVVVMVSQGGTGGSTAAPITREIYEALFGVEGKNADPARSVLPNAKVPRQLPAIRPDGTVVQPARTSGSADSSDSTP